MEVEVEVELSVSLSLSPCCSDASLVCCDAPECGSPKNEQTRQDCAECAQGLVTDICTDDCFRVPKIKACTEYDEHPEQIQLACHDPACGGEGARVNDVTATATATVTVTTETDTETLIEWDELVSNRTSTPGFDPQAKLNTRYLAIPTSYTAAAMAQSTTTKVSLLVTTVAICNGTSSSTCCLRRQLQLATHQITWLTLQYSTISYLCIQILTSTLFNAQYHLCRTRAAHRGRDRDHPRPIAQTFLPLPPQPTLSAARPCRA